MKSVSLLLFFLSLGALAQSQSSGPATTKSECSPANTGNNNTFTIKCGIGREQGQALIKILNKILADQLNPEQVMTKLDEIEKGVSAIQKQVNPNAAKVTYTKRGVKRVLSPGRVIASDEAMGTFDALVELQNEQKWAGLIELSERQIRERPEWYTPFVFAGVGYLNLGNKSKAIELLPEAEEGMADNPDYEDLPQQVRNLLNKLKTVP